jgi:hypothetical protein
MLSTETIKNDFLIQNEKASQFHFVRSFVLITHLTHDCDNVQPDGVCNPVHDI